MPVKSKRLLIAVLLSVFGMWVFGGAISGLSATQPIGNKVAKKSARELFGNETTIHPTKSNFRFVNGVAFWNFTYKVKGEDRQGYLLSVTLKCDGGESEMEAAVYVNDLHGEKNWTELIERCSDVVWFY